MGLSLKQVAPEEDSVEFDWEPVPLEENQAGAQDTQAPAAAAAAPEQQTELDAQDQAESDDDSASEQAEPSQEPEAVKALA